MVALTDYTEYTLLYSIVVVGIPALLMLILFALVYFERVHYIGYMGTVVLTLTTMLTLVVIIESYNSLFDEINVRDDSLEVLEASIVSDFYLDYTEGPTTYFEGFVDGTKVSGTVLDLNVLDYLREIPEASEVKVGTFESKKTPFIKEHRLFLVIE